MFDILTVLKKHTAFLENNLKKLDTNQRKSIGCSFLRFYFLLPNTTECLKKYLKMDITEEQLLHNLKNNDPQYFKDALQKYDDEIGETDPYANDFEELEAMELNILSGLENCIRCSEKSEYALYNFLLLIDILDYYENFSGNPEYWNNLLEQEIKFQQKIAEQIYTGENIDENVYFERYKEVVFDDI